MGNKCRENKAVIEVAVLYCQHGLCDEDRGTAWSQQVEGVSVTATMFPCSSKLEVPYILKLLASGIDAVEVVACPENCCKFLIGSGRAERRIEYIQGLLESIGDAKERVGISRKLKQSGPDLIEIARSRADAVRDLCRNSMKGE